jgi:hypothetical protein
MKKSFVVCSPWLKVWPHLFTLDLHFIKILGKTKDRHLFDTREKGTGTGQAPF